MDRFRLVFLFGLIVALPANAAKGFHLWYDENGQAVYSQFAPDGGRESTEVKPPPPPAESPEVAQRRLQEQMQKFEDNREDRALAEEQAGKSAAERRKASERCDAARNNLQTLKGRPRQLYQTPDGKVMRLSEAEREKRRREMQKIISEACR